MLTRTLSQSLCEVFLERRVVTHSPSVHFAFFCAMIVTFFFFLGSFAPCDVSCLRNSFMVILRQF